MVANFKMPGKVYRTAMSTLATSHMLIAAGTEDVQVRLCDISSGAFAHTLSGHRGMSIPQFNPFCFIYNLSTIALLGVRLVWLPARLRYMGYASNIGMR